MKKTKESNLECSCGTEISDDGRGVFQLLVRALLHLQGAPHNMGKPEHWKSSNSAEVFIDHYNSNHLAVLRKDE